MKRWSSLRRTGAPIPVAPIRSSSLAAAVAVPPLRGGFAVPFFHCLGAGCDCLDDVVIAGAAAEIAFELVPDGRIVEVMTLAVDNVDGGHDHAGGAIAALQPVMLAEGLLHGMQRSVGIGETFDGEHLRPLDLPDEYRARLHGLAVDVHDTGAALRRVAAHMGAGEPQVLAQELHQQRARIHITGDGFTVHRQGDGGHGYPPWNCGRTSCFPGRGSIPATDPVKSARSCGSAREQVNPEMALFVSSAAGRDCGRELHEEIVRCFLCRTVDQALSELRQLAADLCLDVIGKKRATVLVRERDRCAAFCESRDASLPFAGNAVAVRRIEIGKPDFSLPACLDWTNLHGRNSLELVVRDPVELLAARNAALEHFGIVELRPDDFPGCGKLDLPIHGHRHRLVLPLAGPRYKTSVGNEESALSVPGRDPA